MRKGRVTIPTDETFVEETKRIADLWGADAVRDCDGVSLPKNAKELADKVYNTYFIVRGDNEWGRKHPEEAQRIFLESKRVTATEDTLTITVSDGFLLDEIDPDLTNLDRWQVFDRTTNTEVKDFTVNGHNVTIKTIPYHEYSVDFLARIAWHPVQIYNYLTNNWTCEKQLSYDPAYPNTKEYIKRYLQQWLDEHPETNVVRFTTFLYQFNLVFNNKGLEKMVDWFGYAETASIPLLEGFEKETGIRLTAEDFISNGTYNSPFKNPEEKWVKYMDYIQRFVTQTVKELVDIVHKNGREAMMFLGDDWIGAEPYGPYFKDMGLDSVVGSVGGGVTVRMLGEIPHVKTHEGRFLPYFFPDTFFEGNEQGALDELNKNWRTARRALLRCPLDRMGFGGYLSLANMFPSFINRVSEICDEFRQIYETSSKGKAHSVLTVAILNTWGSLRSWQAHMVAHELWYQQIYSYQGVYEILSGLPVNVKFISFNDVLNNEDILKNIDVIINVGDEHTAYSGGDYWKNPLLVEKIRRFVSSGKGFIGVGQPSATDNLASSFALSDVLGVNQEKGFTLAMDKYNITPKSHFITEGIDNIDYGEGIKNIYALDNTDVLDITISPRFKRNVNVGEVKLSANNYFKGRSVYIAGLPYSVENARLLYKALLWSAHKEDDLERVYCDNNYVECAYFEELDIYCLINNSNKKITCSFYDKNKNKTQVTLKPSETKWVK